jgi:hypothetical protein
MSGAPAADYLSTKNTKATKYKAVYLALLFSWLSGFSWTNLIAGQVPQKLENWHAVCRTPLDHSLQMARCRDIFTHLA